MHGVGRPPMTNEVALLDDTEAAFRQVHASGATSCMHFQKVNIFWRQGSVGVITGLLENSGSMHLLILI